MISSNAMPPPPWIGGATPSTPTDDPQHLRQPGSPGTPSPSSLQGGDTGEGAASSGGGGSSHTRPPAKRTKTRTFITLCVVLLVVIAGLGTGVLFLRNPEARVGAAQQSAPPPEVPFKVMVKLTHRDQVSSWYKVPFCYNVKWDGEPQGIPFRAEYLDGESLKRDYQSGTTPTDIKSIRFVAVVDTATIVLARWRSPTCG